LAISLRSVGASPGANSANCIITKPAGLALGDFMLAHVVNKATSGTITPPANWTIIGAQSNTASSRSALFWKVAVQADVDATTFTFTLGTTGRNRGEMMALTGVSTSAPIDVANQQINSAGTSIAVPTPTVTDGCLFLAFGSNALGGTATTCSGSDPTCTITIGYAVAYSSYCALACFSGVKSGTDAVDAHSLATFTSAVSSGHAIALAPQPAPEEHSGAALIHGNGTITPVVQKNGKGAALTSGSGTLAALAIVGMLGLAAISGGPGHLAATWQKDVGSSSIISGGGVQAATGQKASQDVASISGNGSLIATGELSYGEEHSGTAVISGNGTLVASGIAAETHFGTALIYGNGSLVGLGAKLGLDSCGISGGGLLVAISAKNVSGLALISGNGLLIASGGQVESYFGVATISGNGGFISSGLKSAEGTGSITVDSPPPSPSIVMTTGGQLMKKISDKVYLPI